MGNVKRMKRMETWPESFVNREKKAWIKYIEWEALWCAAVKH
jgi:hypothetical protein